jgi:hypothetical protein
LKPQYPYISQYMSEVPMLMMVAQHSPMCERRQCLLWFLSMCAVMRPNWSLLPVTLKAQILSDEPTATKCIHLHPITSHYIPIWWLTMAYQRTHLSLANGHHFNSLINIRGGQSFDHLSVSCP